MTRINNVFARFILLSVAATVAACTDAVGPDAASTGHTNGIGAPPPAGTSISSDEMKPTAVIQTSQGASTPWQGPGAVFIASPAVNAVSRSVLIGGIRVGQIPNTFGMVATTGATTFSLWRWNGSNWGTRPVATTRVSAQIPLTAFGTALMPNGYFNITASGYYRITAHIAWVSYGVEIAFRNVDFNAASDYNAIGTTVAGPGYLTVY